MQRLRVLVEVGVMIELYTEYDDCYAYHNDTDIFVNINHMYKNTKGWKKLTVLMDKVILQELICIELNRQGLWNEENCPFCPIKKILWKLR